MYSTHYNNFNYLLIRNKTVVFYNAQDHTYCSKEILNPEKMKTTVAFFLENNPTCQDLFCKPYKFNTVEKRYQDKRKVERIVREFKEEKFSIGYKPLKHKQEIVKPKEVLKVKEARIPVKVDSKITYYVKESNLLKNEKWCQYFDSYDHLLHRIEQYKLINQ
jgi:hypothetical protein